MIRDNRRQATFVDDCLPIIDGFLKQINESLDWAPIEKLLEKHYATSHTGRPAYPPLVLFKMLLLRVWHKLSFEDTEYHVTKDLSFRQFLGLSVMAPVPDHTTLFRFSEQLKDLLPEIMRLIELQFEARGLLLKEGTLIDASLVPSAANPPRKGRESADRNAKWGGKKDKQIFGYKVHIGMDAGSELIRKVLLTPANEHDSQHFEALISGDEEVVFADKGYCSAKNSALLKKRRQGDGIMHKAQRGNPLEDWEIDLNRQLSKIRSGVERYFGTLKRVYDLWRLKCFGLENNLVHITVAVICYNLKRSLKLSII